MNTIFAFSRKVTTGFLTEDVRNALKTTVDFILLSYVVAVLILAATLGYQKWEADLNRPWAVLKGNPIYSKEQIQKLNKKHGELIFEYRCDELTFIRDRDGRICKADPGEKILNQTGGKNHD